MRSASYKATLANIEDVVALASRPWRAPLAISDVCASDNVNWVSFPTHYPHLISFPHDDGGIHFAIRMRQANGRFKFVGKTSVSAEAMKCRLERLWAELGSAHEHTHSYDPDDFAETFRMFHMRAARVERAALAQHPQDPSWASPLVAVELSAMDAEIRDGITLYCPVVEKSRFRDRDQYAIFIKRPDYINIYHDIPDSDLEERLVLLKLGFSKRVFMHHYLQDEIAELARLRYEEFCDDRAVSASRSTMTGAAAAAVARWRTQPELSPARDMRRPAAP